MTYKLIFQYFKHHFHWLFSCYFKFSELIFFLFFFILFLVHCLMQALQTGFFFHIHSLSCPLFCLCVYKGQDLQEKSTGFKELLSKKSTFNLVTPLFFYKEDGRDTLERFPPPSLDLTPYIGLVHLSSSNASTFATFL